MNRVMAMTSRLDLTLEARSGRRQDLRRREGPPGLLAESPGRKRIENRGSDHETGRSLRRGNGMAGATAPFLLLREGEPQRAEVDRVADDPIPRVGGDSWAAKQHAPGKKFARSEQA